MIIKNESEISINIEGPLYLPFYNMWGENIYLQSKAFDINPFIVRAQSTSGSPVILGQKTFVGFLKECGGRFIYDGKNTLVIEIPQGQEVYLKENCFDPWEEWENYNKIVLNGNIKEDNKFFWKSLEYCTWVEQKKQMREKNSKIPRDMLNEQFVYNYMKRINKLGWPKGKFTIDAGWAVEITPDGDKLFGDWDIDRVKFPNFEKLIEDIKSEGYIPGLWFAPGYITPKSKVGTKHPEWIGIERIGKTELSESLKSYYYVPCPPLKEHYINMFKPFIQMGIKKYKFDMFYEDKSIMKELHRYAYEAIKELDETAEVEIHIPDVFVSRYCDVVRTNDVLIYPDGAWRALTYEHYRVCRYSSPDKVINLDHIGSNNECVNEEEFMEHWQMLKNYDGYPVISLIPDHYSKKTIERFTKEIKERIKTL